MIPFDVFSIMACRSGGGIVQLCGVQRWVGHLEYMGSSSVCSEMGKTPLPPFAPEYFILFYSNPRF